LKKQKPYTHTQKYTSRFIKDSFKDIQPFDIIVRAVTTTVSHLSSRAVTSWAKKQQKQWVNHRLELHIAHKLA
jgi:hypothetical protein